MFDCTDVSYLVFQTPFKEYQMVVQGLASPTPVGRALDSETHGLGFDPGYNRRFK